MQAGKYLVTFVDGQNWYGTVTSLPEEFESALDLGNTDVLCIGDVSSTSGNGCYFTMQSVVRMRRMDTLFEDTTGIVIVP